MYIGSYGTGPAPKFVFRSGTRSFSIEGQGNIIKGLKLMNLDTVSDVLDIRGGPSGSTGRGNRADSLVISGGYRGLTFVRNKTLYLNDITVYNTMDDGIFGGEEGDLTDSVVVSGVHVFGVNKRYKSDPTNSSGGDCMQIRSAYLSVENSVLDHSENGMKFCLINTRTSGNAKTIVNNTDFLMHPHDNHGIYAQNAQIENCRFKGGGTVLMVWGSSLLYNSIFTGYGKDHVYTHSGKEFFTVPVAGVFMDIYNCTFVDIHTAVDATQRDMNIRNCIFYNVQNAFRLGINGINGSGNIHYNADLSEQKGLVNYLQDDGRTKGNTASYFTADPLFRNLSDADYHLQKDSPAVDAADLKVYDPEATFISGYNTSQGWVYYTRKFTGYKKVASDIEGVSRPKGDGYDIGAYEYTENPDTGGRNKPPVIVVGGETSCYSGTVLLLDASQSYDPDGSQISFEWILPESMSSTDIYSREIKIMAPLVQHEQSFPVSLRVTDGTDAESKLIHVNVQPYKPEIERITVYSVNASDFQEPNFPEHLVDNDLETRWSAPGENQWAQFEFDAPVTISHLYISFYQGQKRNAFFELQGSNDGVSWSPVIEYEQSHGFSKELELFIPSVTGSGEQEYKYLRFIGFGNTENEWNSVNEILIHANSKALSTCSCEQNVRVYPNPASEMIRAEIRFMRKDIPLEIKLFDISGKILNIFSYDSVDEEIAVPVSNLSPGIYLLSFTNEAGEAESVRFIKE